jgi:hypothetical protein
MVYIIVLLKPDILFFALREFFLSSTDIEMDGMVSDIITRIVKYLVEGLAVAIAAIIIPQKKLNMGEIGALALLAAAVFAVLDLLAPTVGLTARQGAGFGIGAKLVGFP